MELREALEFALDSQALLFTGSGFSVGAKPVGQDRFLTGRSLASHFYEKCEQVTTDDQLNIASQMFLRKFGPDKLISELHNLFTTESVSASHQDIARVPWQTIFTTNYDDVLEKAYEIIGKPLVPITPQDDSNGRALTGNQCFHINGYAPGSQAIDLDTNLKLSNTSYLTEAFSGSTWGYIFRKSLHHAKAVIFVGYSMYDLDIQRIVHNIEGYKEKIIFIERADLDHNSVEYGIQSDFGTVFPLGLEGFVDVIKEVSATHIPRDDSSTIFDINKIDFGDINNELRDDRVFELLLKGDLDANLISDSLRGELHGPYFVKRTMHDLAVSDVLNGKDVMLIHGDMANGKSAFVQGLTADLRAKGYDFYQIDKAGIDYTHDIQALYRRDGRNALIVENASRNWDAIQQFFISKKPEDLIICTIKSAFLDAKIGDFENMVPEGNLSVIDLDTLSENDITEFIRLLSTYKFWGVRDAWSDAGKTRFIKQECNYQLSSVLLEIVKSPGIRERFDELFSKISEDDEVSHLLVIASVLLVLDFRISDFLLSELAPDNSLRSAMLDRSERISEVLSKNAGEFQFRSSIVAKYALNQHQNNKRLVDQLISLTKAAHHRSGYDSMGQMFFEVYRSMVTFGVIQGMLPEKGKRDALIRFYENVKNLDAAKNHPHFWLQYALARLAYDADDDLDKAKLYLDFAYARASKIDNYHTHHMDNAKARYLVKRASKLNDTADAMKYLREAHQILINQARNEKNHIPYRVARLYSGFYSFHRNSLTDENKEEIFRYCKELLDQVPKLNLNRFGRMDVDLCSQALKGMIEGVGQNT